MAVHARGGTLTEIRPPLAVVDIDGVVADVRHRLEHLQCRPKDWEAFFASASEDPVHPEGAELVAAFAEDHEVVFLTGRPERCRRDTEAWLERHGLRYDRLVMRPHGDRRPAAVVKLELLEELAHDREVSLVVDDDVLVIDAMASMGYPTRLADWEPRAPARQKALWEAQEVDGRA